MTSILNNISVNFSRNKNHSKKNQTANANSGLAGGAPGTYTPLSGSPPNANCLPSDSHAPSNLHISTCQTSTTSLVVGNGSRSGTGTPTRPMSIVGIVGGKGNGSPYESADESASSSYGTVAGCGGAGGSLPRFNGCTHHIHITPTHQDRYYECRTLVQLPNGFDRLEWLAFHATYLVRFVGLFWMTNEMHDSCLCDSLAIPSAVTNGGGGGGGGTVATMVDERTGKKIAHNKLSPKVIITNSLNNMEKILENEDLFPSKYGNSFNQDFENLIRRCCKSLYYITGHLIHSHYAYLQDKSVESSLIDLFSYLITFIRQFSLIDRKDISNSEDLELALSRRDSPLATSNLT